MKCEISVEELNQLFEENEKTRNLLLTLLESAGEDISEYTKTEESARDKETNLGIPIMPTGMMRDSAKKWQMIYDILVEEISSYEESLDELRSLKRISRNCEEYEETEKEVQSSGELINGLQDVIAALQKRDRIRRGIDEL